MNTENSKLRIMTFSAVALALNIVLGFVGAATKLPFYLDTIGTIFVAVTFGPMYGAIVGGLTNFLSALVLGPTDIPFMLVSIAVGLVSGLIAKKARSFNLPIAIITGIVCGIVAPIIGTPIGVWVYGGLTGTGMDFLVLFLKQSGMSIFAASFIPKLINNLLDKTASAVLVFLLISGLPNNMKPKWAKVDKISEAKS